MKLSRLAAGGAGLALVAASVFGATAAASADDIDVVVPNPIPAEGSSYPAGWFAGDVTGGPGSASQSPAGLTIVGGVAGYQLLNGDPVNGSPISLADALSYQQVSTTGGDAFFQISVFGEPGASNQQFTTLRPVDASIPWDGQWTSSQSVAGLTANQPYTKAALIAALDGDAAAQVLAFGVFVNAGDTVTVRAIDFGGDTYVFAAQPGILVSPSSVALADRSKPVTVTGSGFAPGETVYFGFGGENGGGLLDDVEAGEDGTASITFIPGELAEGQYTFSVSDESGSFGVFAPFSITANAVAALPATGLDTTGALAAGGVLLMAGAALALMTLRRKDAQA